MMLLSTNNGVLEGYAAFNFAPRGWKGVIEGNIFCKEYRATSAEALADAKKTFELVRQ